MNILVYDIAASETGALTVLNDFYQQAANSNDKTINWIFVVSIPELKETKHIKVLRYPWVKKSRFHRLIFDYFCTKGIIKRYKIDTVLSLQNIIVPNTKIHQIVYVHQAIPFVEYRFKLKENWRSWVYQNLIGRKIIDSIRNADKVIVQTEWMRTSCSQKADIDINNIEVVKMTPTLMVEKKYIDSSENSKVFFYPAAATQSYKNHLIILKACKEIQNRNIKNFKVIFTFTGNENKNAIRLREYAEKYNLNVDFIGLITIEEVFNLYSKSILLFPSLIETVGLPLLEGKYCGTPIITSDLPYAHEVLSDYPNAYYFDPTSVFELSRLMEKFINYDYKYNEHIEDEELRTKLLIDVINGIINTHNIDEICKII